MVMVRMGEDADIEGSHALMPEIRGGDELSDIKPLIVEPPAVDQHRLAEGEAHQGGAALTDIDRV